MFPYLWLMLLTAGQSHQISAAYLQYFAQPYLQQPYVEQLFETNPGPRPVGRRPGAVIVPPTTPPGEPQTKLPQAAVPAAAAGTALSEVEADVLAYTNDVRAEHGLAPLAANQALERAARAHSADMLKNDYFDHVDRSGCDPGCRITNAGYAWQAFGENIHMMSGYGLGAEGTAHKIVDDWLASPGHRANLLNATYTDVGIGVASAGDTYDTAADYAEPR